MCPPRPLQGEGEDVTYGALETVPDVRAEVEADGRDEAEHHHERVVRRQARLRRAQQGRHQELYEARDAVDRAVHDYPVERAREAAEPARQPRRAVDRAVYHARVGRVDAARRVHRAPRDELAVQLVNPVLVEARAVERREPPRPEVGQVRTPDVEEEAEPDAEARDYDREDDEEPLRARVAAERVLDRVREVEARVAVRQSRARAVPLVALRRERRAAAPLSFDRLV